MNKVVLNNKLVSKECYQIAKSAYYEVIRFKDGAPLFFEDHINRLNRSIHLAGHQQTVSNNTIIKGLKTLVKAEGTCNQNIKIEVTFSPQLQVAIFYIPSHYPANEVYRRGVDVKTICFERANPNVKQMSYDLNNIRQRIEREKVHDFLLLNRQGEILEGSKTNVFAISKGIVYTPKSSKILSGITRKKVLELAKSSYTLKEQSLHIKDLNKFSAFFLTGTSIGILPINRIDEHVLLSTKQSVVKELIKNYNNMIENYIQLNQLFV